MRFQRLIAVPMLLVALFGFAAPVARADTTACFCNVTDVGATKIEGATDSTTCKSKCLAAYPSTLAANPSLWALDPTGYPPAILQCWAKETACTGLGGVYSKGDQPAECLPGSHYCYAGDNLMTTLNVSIPTPNGDVTQVVNLADYLGVIYDFLMGFAMTITIVLMMIGGIRYVMGASSGDVGKAKAMIKNAVEGFVLLMFAYVILYTVNPQLLRLQVPKLPKLRAVHITAGDESCEFLLGDNVVSVQGEADEYTGDGGYVVKYTGAEACGTSGEVISDPAGVAVAAGTTCDFVTCPSAGQSCFKPTSGKSGCHTCEELTMINANPYIPPSEDVCSNFIYPPGNVAGASVAGLTQCILTHDSDLSNFPPTDIGTQTIGNCAKMEINCTSVTSCLGYDSVLLKNADENACLSTLYGSDTQFSDTCVSDPCKVAPSGQSCVVMGLPGITSTAGQSCVNSGFRNALVIDMQSADGYSALLNSGQTLTSGASWLSLFASSTENAGKFAAWFTAESLRNLMDKNGDYPTGADFKNATCNFE
ncbi:MAG: pilin [Candidatus Uhrbacteria bacterium]